MRIRRFAAPCLLSLLAPIAAQTPGNRMFDVPVLNADLDEEVECIGDVDGDGDVDLLAFRPWGLTSVKLSYRVLFNDGAGRFTGGPSVPMPPSSGVLVVFGDVTGDGLPDLVASSYTGLPAVAGLWLFRSTAGGAFAAPVYTPMPGLVSELELGDADGNGRLDVLAVHAGVFPTSSATWLADSPIGLAVVVSTSFGSAALGDVVPLHLDGDGRTDLAVLEEVGSNWILHAVRTTTLGFAVLASTPIATGFAATLVPADLDSDGDDDLLLSTPVGVSTIQLTQLLHVGGGVFAQSPAQGITGADWRRWVPADLDFDGDLDLVGRTGNGSTTPPRYTMARFRNDAGTFVQVRSHVVPLAVVGLGAGLVDLDADGFLDYVDAKSTWSGNVDVQSLPVTAPSSLLDWDGDGDLDGFGLQTLRSHDGALGFAAVPGAWPAPGPNSFWIEPIHVGDFDADGKPEVLVPLVQQATFQPQQFLGVRRLEANGDDQLSDQGLAVPLPQRMESGVVDDLDSDGDLDVLDKQGAWVQGPPGSFALQPLALSTYRPIAKGDVDGDGDIDFLAIHAQGTTSTALLLRTGPLAFQVVVLSPVLQFLVDEQYAILADLDDDGDLDVACRERTGPTGFQTRVFLGTAGVFAPSLAISLEGRLAAGDMDLDGRTDLVVLESSRVHVLRRIAGPLGYAPAVTYAVSGALGIIDIDQDGDLDLNGTTVLVNEAVRTDLAGVRRQYGTGGLGLDARRPLLSAVGPIQQGQPLTIRARRALGGTLGVFVFSNTQALLPNVLPGLTAYVASIDGEFALGLGGAPGQAGLGSLDAVFQVPPGIGGFTVYAQFVALDAAAPSGLAHSNGVEFRIGH